MLCCALCGALVVVPTEAMNQRQSKIGGIKVRVTLLEEDKVRAELPDFEETVLIRDTLKQVHPFLEKYLEEKAYKTDARVTFVLPKSVTEIGSYAFGSFREVLQKLDVPDQHPLEKIEMGAFRGCEDLCSIGENRPNPFPNLRSIGENACADCYKLETPSFNEDTPLIELDRTRGKFVCSERANTSKNSKKTGGGYFL